MAPSWIQANHLPAPTCLRDTPYSNRLKKQIIVVAKLHTQVANRRDHHQKKIARRIERTVRVLAIEEHSVLFMIKNKRLSRAASDRAIARMKMALKSCMGLRYVPVGTSRPGIGGNSQTCLCGAKVPKKLSERVHHCTACGLTAPRDVVSANIVMDTAFGCSILGEKVRFDKDNKENEVEVVRKTAGLAELRGETNVADLGMGKTPMLNRRPGVETGHSVHSPLEVSLKRTPDLSEGSETAGGEPNAIANTSCELSEGEYLSVFPREANTQIQDKNICLAGRDCSASGLRSGLGSTVSLGR